MEGGAGRILTMRLLRRANRTLRRFADVVAAVMSSPWTFIALMLLCLPQLLGGAWAQRVLYASNDLQLWIGPLLGVSGGAQILKVIRLLRQVLAEVRHLRAVVEAAPRSSISPPDQG